MAITNNHSTALQLPGGTVLQPGVSTPVDGWENIRKNNVVAAWVKAGVLSEGAGKAAKASGVTVETNVTLPKDADPAEVATTAAAALNHSEPAKADRVAKRKTKGKKA